MRWGHQSGSGQTHSDCYLWYVTQTQKPEDWPMAPYPPQDSGVQLQQRKNLLIVEKNPRGGAVNIRQKVRTKTLIVVIWDCFQAGELLSDGDCHNSTKEKLRKQEKQKLSCSSDFRPNNVPDEPRSTSVTSPIAMRYWNYCTNRSAGDQVVGRWFLF